MKEGWETKRLGEVCKIKPPKIEARQRLSNTDFVSFVPMEDLGIDQKILIPKQVKPLSEVAGSYTYFSEGDVLLAKITPCFENGKLGIAANLTNGIGFGSSEYIVFRTTPSVDKEWLYYFLSRDSFKAEGAERMSGAVGHKRVAKEFIETYPIPVPPLSEQQRIVGILDEAFEGIATAMANAEKNLENARAIFESELNAIFTKKGEGWEEKPLEADARFIDYRGRTPTKTPMGLRLITAKNIRMGMLQREPEEFVSPDTYHAWMTRGIPEKGDVLFTTEAPLGFVCQLDTDEKVVFAQRIITIQTNRDALDPTYLKWALISSVVQSRIHANATGATAQGIKASLLKKVMIPMAPYAEQKKIVAKCDSLSEETGCLGTIYQRKLSALDALKKSLLNEAFTGNL